MEKKHLFQNVDRQKEKPIIQDFYHAASKENIAYCDPSTVLSCTGLPYVDQLLLRKGYIRNGGVFKGEREMKSNGSPKW